MPRSRDGGCPRKCLAPQVAGTGGASHLSPREAPTETPVSPDNVRVSGLLKLSLWTGLLAVLLAVPRQAAERAIFFDDFSGPSLDRSHWNVIVTGRTVNDEQQAYVDSTDVLSFRDGALVIQPRFRQGFKTPEGRIFDFICSAIPSVFSVSSKLTPAAAPPAGSG